jgi:AAA domain
MPDYNWVSVSYGNERVQRRNSQPVPWIWDGVIAEGAITLLSAPEKTGKTTLLSLLLDRRREGGLLLGTAVCPGRSILCSEESDALWALRQPPLDFGPQLEYHRPLDSTLDGWRRYINSFFALNEGYFDLLVIDTAMSFLPANVNNRATVRQALNELRDLTGLPCGVLLLHQANTARGLSSTRGPLAAFADILIDVQIPLGDRSTRRRHFDGVGRYPGTLQHVAAELNLEGTDYVQLPAVTPEAAVAPALVTARQLLSESAEPLTCQEILARWPATVPPPRYDSLSRSLARGCELGILVRTGTGTKTEPFRYALVDRPSAV